MDKGKIAQLIIARLDGLEISRRFSYYQSLVRRGIGGFIVFGGDVKEIRDGIRRLQEDAEYPLFIASDLEQGLGQQIEGGTIFPPQMAIASAIDINRGSDKGLLKNLIDAIANEAKAVGINLILAPVADVITNPENPIICTRSFSDNPETVGWFVKEYVRNIQRHGLIACVKHFPGHGDTSVDSHLAVPTISVDIKRLEDVELHPFRVAIDAGVKMVMIGHLKVPAIDRALSTFSKKIITGLLRERMGFGGLVTTDAMTMEAVKKYGDNAYTMAIKAGVDIILHPESPERVIDILYEKGRAIESDIERSFMDIIKIKKRIKQESINIRSIGKRSHIELSRTITNKALRIGHRHLLRMKDIFSGCDRLTLLVIDDDNNKSGQILYQSMKRIFKGLRYIYVDNNSGGNLNTILISIKDRPILIAVYSRISAYKGRAFINRRLESFMKKAIGVAKSSIVIGFCCPYSIRGLRADVVINAYSNLGMSEECVVEWLLSEAIEQD